VPVIPWVDALLGATTGPPLPESAVLAEKTLHDVADGIRKAFHIPSGPAVDTMEASPAVSTATASPTPWASPGMVSPTGC
jgi:hypothetical protein